MGISVRDAADATRLRADVIENMESGEFNYKLPEIYKRGFLRIYAAFLKLDVDAVLEQYSIALRGSGEEARRRSNLLSRMASATVPQKDFAPPQSSLESRFETFDKSSEGEGDESEQADYSAKFIKLAALFGGVILAVVLIIFIVSSAVSKNAPEENPDIQMNANMPTQPAAPVSEDSANAINAVAAAEFSLALTALADTYVLVYPDIKTSDGKPAEALYTGPMQGGERREFRSAVPLMVKLTDAERIKIERNGTPLDLKGAKGLRLFRIVSK